MKKFVKILVKGIVQGVGFRPFIYRIAHEHNITGNVRNDTEGVSIIAGGENNNIDAFISDIQKKHPPLSFLQDILSEDIPLFKADKFTIEKSASSHARAVSIAPDTALCDDCLKEFFDKDDRRYHYPFITCTNCGPRFSIIYDIPYDRVNTTMSAFKMCAKCAAEYDSPDDRRFHTQPNACADCGPKLFLHKNDGTVVSCDIEFIAADTVRLILEGKIIAIKSVGGYLLAADASSDTALERLRQKKARPFKPFALMAGSIEKIRELAFVSKTEEQLLLSKERPIVLLKQKKNNLSNLVAPSLSCIGIMLPYTPFQHHLFSLKDIVLVMTSGNIADEPIIHKDKDALGTLSGIADYFVSFNREISSQTDDSVLFLENEKPYFIRRSRGYVPVPFISKTVKRHILAVGGDLKNTFAFAKDDVILLSQHLGDLASPAGNALFRTTIDHFKQVYDFAPELVVSDMHPGYFTTEYADEVEEAGCKRLRVQHHHAHIAGVLEEHNIEDKVIGIAFDGTGYGTDGTLWGSDFLIADRKTFERAAHFSNFPLPGGESAIKDVWKIGLSLLYRRFGNDYPVMQRSPKADAVIEVIQKQINSPMTCSIGRIFDGIAALLGIRQSISAEAEAAMLLEEAAMRGRKNNSIAPFNIPVQNIDSKYIISTEELTEYIVSLIVKGKSVDDIAFAFHASICGVAVKMAVLLREKFSLNKVALSGGVFQNRLLLSLLIEGLREKKIDAYMNNKVPCNDGGISLGQIAIGKEIAGYK
jgi:hydrogenase maturation protein HypF